MLLRILCAACFLEHNIPFTEVQFLLLLIAHSLKERNYRKMFMKSIACIVFVGLVQDVSSWTNPFTKSNGVKPTLGKKSTAADVLRELNTSDRLAPFVKPSGTAIVTGANTGIGAVTAATLAMTGMKVILCSRDVEKGNEALQTSIPSWCRENVVVQQLDLADLNSVQQTAEEISSDFESIDVIVNNAGVMSPPTRLETEQNIELQFGINHVGHHMFTRLLLPKLNSGGRIVTVASTAHTMGSSENWGQGTYTPWGAYGQSKLANILFAKELQDRLDREGGQDDAKIKSVTLHPGVIGTNLWQYTPILQTLSVVFADKTVQQGAATNVYCALADDVVGGGYYDNCQLTNPNDLAENVSVRKELWDYTEELIESKGFQLPSELFTSVKDTVSV